MSLTFRPDMKTIVHEVDGNAITVMGKSIDGTSSALVAMVETGSETDRFRPGATVRCSYVEPTGVHGFTSVILSVDSLALNHRLLRLTIAAPTDAERLQRRNDVRVCLELPVEVSHDGKRPVRCTSIDVSAGGMAVAWPQDRAVLDHGEMVRVSFHSDRFDHDHEALVLGSRVTGDTTVLRLKFEGITNAGRDRLATVVFRAQRDELKRQRDADVD